MVQVNDAAIIIIEILTFSVHSIIIIIIIITAAVIIMAIIILSYANQRSRGVDYCTQNTTSTLA